MSSPKYYKGIVCVCLLVVFGAGGVFAQGATGKDVLSMVPSESMFVARINNFEYTLGELDKYIAGIAPVPMGARMIVRAKLAEALGSPELQGVNMNGSFAVFGVADPDSYAAIPDVYIGVLVPISDFGKFVSGNPNVSEPDENGVVKISAKNDDGGEPWLIAIQAGDHALVTIPKLYEQVLFYKDMMGLGTSGSGQGASIAAGLDAVDAKAAKSEPIWAYGDIQLARQAFGTVLLDKFDEFKTGIVAQIKNDAQGPMMDMEGIFDMYGMLLEGFLEEAKFISIALEPKADVLTISETICALPGTHLAGLLIKDNAGQKNTLMGYAEDGSAAGFYGHVGKSWKRMYDVFFDLLPTLVGESVDADGLAQMKAITAKMIDVLGGPVAGTFTVDPKTKPPFAVKYVLSIKDAAKFKELLKESTELFDKSGIADLYKGMGIEIDYSAKYNADSYKGISIDFARLTMKSTQPDTPPGKMIEAMYGGGFDYRWAVMDEICAVVVGGDADSEIRALIDQVKAGAKPVGSEMKAAMSMLPGSETADFVVTYNYVRLLKMVGVMTASMGENAPKMGDINVPTTSNINIAGWGGVDRGTVKIALPKQHLIEIISAFMQLQQNAGAQQPK